MITDIFPSTKTVASLKLPDYDSGKLVTQYSHEHATFSTAVSANHSPVIDFSATIGTPGIAFGAESSYATESHKFLKYNAGTIADKGDSLRFHICTIWTSSTEELSLEKLAESFQPMRTHLLLAVPIWLILTHS
ncbi:hypothetical protein SAY87_031043 [Trapa incisa]|uniref:Uncharacterized protein n=1 Tax=Trapa incisa TaxID=236973 RepID=A0AAN7KWB2_9MYRT|nr:hypothetical protein SAY87_031043 [Trapa incisa]